MLSPRACLKGFIRPSYRPPSTAGLPAVEIFGRSVCISRTQRQLQRCLEEMARNEQVLVGLVPTGIAVMVSSQGDRPTPEMSVVTYHFASLLTRAGATTLVEKDKNTMCKAN